MNAEFLQQVAAVATCFDSLLLLLLSVYIGLSVCRSLTEIALAVAVVVW